MIMDLDHLIYLLYTCALYLQVKLFSVFGLIEKSCDRVLHEISLSCDQQSYDRNDVEHSDSSVISISVLEGKETGLQNRYKQVFTLDYL